MTAHEEAPQPDESYAPPEQNFAVDASRSYAVKPNSPEAFESPDAVWVAVVSDSFDEAQAPEAKSAAIRFASQRYGPNDGCDMVDGPHVDDGQKTAFVKSPGMPSNDGVLSAEQYRHMAAVQKASSVGGRRSRYVTFYRVRRLAQL